MNQVIVSIIAFIVLIGGSSLFISYHLPAIIAERKANHDNVPRVAASDFLICIPLVAGMLVIKSVLSKFLSKYVTEKILVLKQGLSESEIAHRKVRFDETVYNSIYYVVISIFGWIVLHDKEWVPYWVFGAKGDKNLIYNGFWEHDPNEIKYYYLVELSCSLSQTISFFFFRRIGKDLAEYSIHHFTTISLILFSYLVGYFRVGALVLFLHDFSDIFSAFARVLADTTMRPLALILLLVSVIVWSIYRLFYMTRDIIMMGYAYSKGNSDVTMTVGLVLLGFLHILVALHAYWIHSFCSIIYSQRKKVIEGVKQLFDKKKTTKKE